MRSLFLLIICLCFSPHATGVETSAVGIDNFATDSAVRELHKSLQGSWRNSVRQSDGGYKDEFLTVSDNGTFRLRFITSNTRGQVVDAYAIVGLWGVAQNIFFTSNLTYMYHNDVEYEAYLGDTHEFNAYRILELNESILRYQRLGKDNSAKLERLAIDPCISGRGLRVACVDHERIREPDGSNNGSTISLAE